MAVPTVTNPDMMTLSRVLLAFTRPVRETALRPSEAVTWPERGTVVASKAVRR